MIRRIGLLTVRVIAAAFVLCIGLVIAGMFILQALSRSSVNQRIFEQGSLPSPVLSGPYVGAVGNFAVPWKGKEFNAVTGTGINLFLGSGGLVFAYPFHTLEAKGLTDPNLTVLRIDYNQPSNPWWLKHITDELVQVESGSYLGKVQVTFLFKATTVGYFTLKVPLQ